MKITLIGVTIIAITVGGYFLFIKKSGAPVPPAAAPTSTPPNTTSHLNLPFDVNDYLGEALSELDALELLE